MVGEDDVGQRCKTKVIIFILFYFYFIALPSALVEIWDMSVQESYAHREVERDVHKRKALRYCQANSYQNGLHCIFLPHSGSLAAIIICYCVLCFSFCTIELIDMLVVWLMVPLFLFFFFFFLLFGLSAARSLAKPGIP